MAKEVYCPKCNQTFEEGSRRFCPTDGARLISDQFETTSAGKGIFSSLLTKTEPSGTRDEVVSQSPVTSEPTFTLDLDEDLRDEGEPFFGLEEPPPPPAPNETYQQPDAEPEAKPFGRKV